MANVVTTKTQTIEETKDYLKQQVELLDKKIENQEKKLNVLNVDKTRIIVIMDNLNKLKEQ